jgi:peptidoglycan/LPS O-acetylase OafA/YrhL
MQTQLLQVAIKLSQGVAIANRHELNMATDKIVKWMQKERVASDFIAVPDSSSTEPRWHAKSYLTWNMQIWPNGVYFLFLLGFPLLWRGTMTKATLNKENI